MAKIEYPDKSKGDQFFGTEATEIKDVVNENVDLTEPSTWYVHSAPKGDNANVGSANFPFETIGKANTIHAEGDIIRIIDEGYSSNENITITKKTVIIGPAANIIDGEIKTLLQGNWTVSGNKDVIFENLTTQINWSNTTNWVFQVINGVIRSESTFPARLTQLTIWNSSYVFEVNSNFNSFDANFCSGVADNLLIAQGFVLDHVYHEGSISGGVDGARSNTIRGTEITGNVTITGNLEKINSVVVGTETVSGTTTNRQAKVFDDNVLFKGQVTVSGVTISFTATPTFDFDTKPGGNVQKMILTANVTTLTIANELPSGSYRAYLTEDGTGGHTIPTPDSSWGTEMNNSAGFETGPDAINLIDIAVDPDGNKLFSINTKS